MLTTKPERHNRTKNRRGCPRQYGQEVTGGLRVAWEATDRKSSLTAIYGTPNAEEYLFCDLDRDDLEALGTTDAVRGGQSAGSIGPRGKADS